jgi:hypothetical protein
MHVPIKVKSPNNISEWQIRFNSAFKGLIYVIEWRLRGLDVHKHKYEAQLLWGYERIRSNKTQCTMQHLGGFV